MINYGFFETPLGTVLLAATPQGLCSLRMCQFHGAGVQIAEVKADFWAEELVENPEAVQSYADQLIGFLQSPTNLFTPTLDVSFGTAFQREVWAALQCVRPGETVTYTELAARVGHPAAVRAAASACAKNQIAIAIPCHRAVRQDGSLAGFRWAFPGRSGCWNGRQTGIYHSPGLRKNDRIKYQRATYQTRRPTPPDDGSVSARPASCRSAVGRTAILFLAQALQRVPAGV